jgi:hypothetical protein
MGGSLPWNTKGRYSSMRAARVSAPAWTVVVVDMVRDEGVLWVHEEEKESNLLTRMGSVSSYRGAPAK